MVRGGPGALGGARTALGTAPATISRETQGGFSRNGGVRSGEGPGGGARGMQNSYCELHLLLLFLPLLDLQQFLEPRRLLLLSFHVLQFQKC